MNENVVITKETLSRLVHDVKDIIKNPLTDHGIYYHHDDRDMLKGYALIIGPTETLYEGGFYLFRFIYPINYPFSPPELYYYTNDGKTRFNPNLYRNGRVCISLLNTWRGEQWTSCQSTRSILLALVLLFNNEPLLNEPGIGINHRDFHPYNKIIEFKNYEIAILGMVTRRYLPSIFKRFYPLIEEHFLKNYDKIIKRVKGKSDLLKEPPIIHTILYKMNIILDYSQLHENMKKIHNKLLKE